MNIKEYEKLIQQHPDFVLKNDLDYNKIQNIKKFVANDANENDIIAFLDTSLFRNAKKGILITKYAIYQDVKVPFLGVKEMNHSFGDKNQISLSFVYNNQTKKEMVVTVKNKQMLFVKILYQIVERYNKDIKKANAVKPKKKEVKEKPVFEKLSDKLVNLVILGGNDSGKDAIKDALIKVLGISKVQEGYSQIADVSLTQVFATNCTYQLYCVDEDEEVIEAFAKQVKNVDGAIIVSDIHKEEDEEAIISMREISRIHPKFMVLYFNQCDQVDNLEERLEDAKSLMHDYALDFYDGDFSFVYGSDANDIACKNILSKIPETKFKKYENAKQYIQDFVDGNLWEYRYEDVVFMQECINNDKKLWSYKALDKIDDYKYQMNGDYYYQLALKCLDKKDTLGAKKYLDMASMFHHAPAMYKAGNTLEAAKMWYIDAMQSMYETSEGEQKQEWYDRIHTEFQPGFQKVACVNHPDSAVCQYCRNCVKICRGNAISFVDGMVTIDVQHCVGCGKCIDDCPYNFIHYNYTRIKKHKPDYQVLVDTNKCDNCGVCASECPIEVFSIIDNQVNVFDELCFGCGYCIDICPHEAIKVISLNKVGE